MFDDEDRKAIEAAVEVLNRHGRPAGEFLQLILEREENEEAYGWITDIK